MSFFTTARQERFGLSMAGLFLIHTFLLFSSSTHAGLVPRDTIEVSITSTTAPPPLRLIIIGDPLSPNDDGSLSTEFRNTLGSCLQDTNLEVVETSSPNMDENINTEDLIRHYVNALTSLSPQVIFISAPAEESSGAPLTADNYRDTIDLIAQQLPQCTLLLAAPLISTPDNQDLNQLIEDDDSITSPMTELVYQTISDYDEEEDAPLALVRLARRHTRTQDIRYEVIVESVLASIEDAEVLGWVSANVGSGLCAERYIPEIQLLLRQG